MINNENVIESTSEKIRIVESLCSTCGACLKVCPYGVLVKGDDGKPKIGGVEDCISCGQCAAICPEDALKHQDFPAGRIKPINISMQMRTDGLISLLRFRRSIRAFQSELVEKDLMELIIDGANTGPSPNNAQRIEYVVIQDTETRNKIIGTVAEIYGKIIYLIKNPEALKKMPGNIQRSIKMASSQLKYLERITNRIKINDDIIQRGTPSLLFLHAPKTEYELFEPKIDATISMQNAALVSSSLGLGCVELGYIEIIAEKYPEIQNILEIPENHSIYGVLAIGYPQYTFKNWIERKQPTITWKN